MKRHVIVSLTYEVEGDLANAAEALEWSHTPPNGALLSVASNRSTARLVRTKVHQVQQPRRHHKPIPVPGVEYKPGAFDP